MDEKIQRYSVIIPVFNGQKYLPRAIESVLTQTYKDLELILVDDGSLDESGLICDSYALKDNRIHVVHKPNGGVSSARNAGLEIAKAEYVVFLDSDDYLGNSFLEDFGENDCDLIVSSYVIEDELQQIIHIKDYVEKKYCIKNNLRIVEKDFIDGYFNYACTKRFKRNILEENKIRFSEELNISEDTLFVIKYLCHANSVVVKNMHQYHYVKYDHETLTNQKLSESLIYRIEKANNYIYNQLKCLFGPRAEQITAARIAALYRNFLVEITNSESVEKEFLFFLFKQHWFKKVIARKDFIPNEDWKYRAVIRMQSAYVFWKYLKYKRHNYKYKKA